jgi:hypothetical protein
MIKINIIYIVLLALAIMLDFGIIDSLADITSNITTPSLLNVSGSWKICGLGTDHLELTQLGNHVYGTYNTPQGPGTIDGIVDPTNAWTGSWSEPSSDEAGYFSAAFSSDNEFSGKWVYYNNDCTYTDCGDNWQHLYGDSWDGSFQGKKIVSPNKP